LLNGKSTVSVKPVVAFSSQSVNNERQKNTTKTRACRNAGPFFFVTNKSQHS
jgi:hypothetical protein